MIIEIGLDELTILQIKHLRNAGLQWDELKKEYLKSTNTRKAIKLMQLANWSWNHEVNAVEAFHEIQLIADEFVDMNNSRNVDIDELLAIWYLHGLGDQFATLRESIIGTNTSLNPDYVLSHV